MSGGRFSLDAIRQQAQQLLAAPYGHDDELDALEAELQKSHDEAGEALDDADLLRYGDIKAHQNELRRKIAKRRNALTAPKWEEIRNAAYREWDRCAERHNQTINEKYKKYKQDKAEACAEYEELVNMEQAALTAKKELHAFLTEYGLADQPAVQLHLLDHIETPEQGLLPVQYPGRQAVAYLVMMDGSGIETPEGALLRVSKALPVFFVEQPNR